ncbi:MAG: AI-2E family transporter [Candidatus Promineifilaceae bacterium]
MEEKNQEVSQNPPQKPPVPQSQSSPRWRTSTKRLAITTLLVLTLLGIYAIRTLLIPIIMAMVLAYVVLPIVEFIHTHTRLNRTMAIALVYLVIVAILIAIPLTTIPQLINQGNNLINNIPHYIEDVGKFLTKPLVIGDYTVPLNELRLEQVYDVLSRNLIDIIQTIGRQGFNIFGSVASRTVSTVLWIIIVLVLSLYMVRDYRELWGSIIALTPKNYHADLEHLGRDISATWNDFLRGQLILGFVVGTIVTIVALIIKLPNALALGLLAGILEFIPNIGPTLAAVPAILLALFQSQGSWLGVKVGPVWFAIIVLGLYFLIQQVENNFLVPRIIGRSLNLRALVVFIGALAGASIAGVLGILLAAPVLATGRIILKYIYDKLLDLPPFPEKGNK